MNKSYFIKHCEVLRGNSANTPGKHNNISNYINSKLQMMKCVFSTDTFLPDYSSIYQYNKTLVVETQYS